MNRLYYGDCLTVMQQEMKVNSVDLIYLDPPFNSNRAYNAIYKDETGHPLPEQIEAFCDLWELDEESERSIRRIPQFMLEEGIDGDVIKFWRTWMDALRYTNPKMLAYLTYMTERLLQMKIVLRPTGSIYLHCDPTASHYIKVIMDGIFGHRNFRNEIVWQRTFARKGNLTKGLARDADYILRYSMTDQFTWNPAAVTIPYDLDNLDEQTLRQYSQIEPETGRRMSYTSITAPTQDIESNRTYELMGVVRTWRWNRERMQSEVDAGRIIQTQPGNVPRYIRYLDEQKGRTLNTIWTDIPNITPNEEEHQGYPTQKPANLLKRIIESSSNENDVVFDPFCGCGTTLEAAQRSKRKWIGIDIAIHAIKRVSSIRLKYRCGLVHGQDYEITGVPQNIEGAEDLWNRDPYLFQKWVVEIVEGFVTARKTRDGGVDGRIYFSTDENNDLKAMKLDVKGEDKVGIKDLYALAGIIDEEDYPMGGFITRKTLERVQKQNFEDFCRRKGEIVIRGVPYPRLQILCVEEILNGERFNTPLIRGRASTDQLSFNLERD